MSEKEFLPASRVTVEQLTASYWQLAPKLKELYESLPETRRLPGLWLLSLPAQPGQLPLAAPLPSVLVQQVLDPPERRIAFQRSMLDPADGPRFARKWGLTLSHPPNALLMGAMAWAASASAYAESDCSSVAEMPARHEVFIVTLRAHQLDPLVGSWPVKRMSEAQIELCIQPPLTTLSEVPHRWTGITIH